MPIVARVTGVGQVIERFTATSVAVKRRVFGAVQNLGLRLESNVKSDWLSGHALHRRTGRLASSITSVFKATDASATARVGTNVVYGRVWELGFTGVVNVGSYTRRVNSRSVYGAGRHTNKNKVAQGLAYVRPFQRHVHNAARPFLAPALDEMRGTIHDEIQAAVNAGVAEGG
jgi:phage gpG-like protein